MESNKKRALIICTGNVARSQMGEGLLRHFGGDAAPLLEQAVILNLFQDPSR